MKQITESRKSNRNLSEQNTFLNNGTTVSVVRKTAVRTDGQQFSAT